MLQHHNLTVKRTGAITSLLEIDFLIVHNRNILAPFYNDSPAQIYFGKLNQHISVPPIVAKLSSSYQVQLSYPYWIITTPART